MVGGESSAKHTRDKVYFADASAKCTQCPFGFKEC